MSSPTACAPVPRLRDIPNTPGPLHGPDQLRDWLQPLPLAGGLLLPSRILPGPMEGITAGSFCQVMMELGLVRAWITPFLRISTGVPRRSRLQAWLLPFFPSAGNPGIKRVPVVAQLMGTETDLLAQTASRLAELGATGIDLNCACPSQVVVRHGAGGACLRRPEWIHATLTALRQACPKAGVSVKVRAGFAAADELPDILAAVKAAKPDFVVLHYRTVAEGFRTVADGWNRLALAREQLPGKILLGSGDLFTVEDALEMFRITGVDGVTPARGLLRNPWLLLDLEAACRGESVPEHTTAAKREFLQQFIAAMGTAWHPGAVMELVRYLFGREHPLFDRLAACNTPAAMLAALRSPH